MALIVVPLTSVLLWLGWRSVDLLEQRSADQRVSRLESAVEDFLTAGLHVVVSVGQTLAFGPSFNAAENPVTDEDRRHQLVAMLRRHPAVQSAFVGYADSSFIYAGRPETFSIEQRIELDAPDGESIIVRVIEAGAPPRTETYWFHLPDGTHGPARTTTTSFDARIRPWYVEAMKAKQAILTEPYRFAQTPDAGISAGIPLRSGLGVMGFDFTLRTLSQLLTAYKITANSVIVVGHADGAVEIESEPCAPTLPGCLPEDALVRQILHKSVVEAVATDAKIDRQVEAGGHVYRVIVHRMPPSLGQRFVIAAAVPVRELTAESEVLLQRAAMAAALAVALAVIGALAALYDTTQVHHYRPLAAALHQRIVNLHNAFRQIVFAQVRIAALNALFTGIFLWVALPMAGIHLPFVKTLILITFVAGLLPVAGNLISNTVIVVISLSHSLTTAAAALLFLITIHKLEYFLNAKIIGTQINARSWELLGAMLLMESLFGIPGVIAAPVFYAYVKTELTGAGLV